MRQRIALLICCVFFVAGSALGAPREITGRLVERGTGKPVRAQDLELLRPGGLLLPALSLLVIPTLRIPQPVVISRAMTGRRGEFRFSVTMDRGPYLGPFLSIRPAGVLRADFSSKRGFALEELADSFSPASPQVGFSAVEQAREVSTPPKP